MTFLICNVSNISRVRPAAGRGQNHRGAGRRYGRPNAELIRERFSIWLGCALDAGRIDPKQLARALSDDPADHNRVSRSQVQQWLARERTVSAISAYRVGEALRGLGLEWSCGCLTLYAAGHFTEFLAGLRSLSHRDTEFARELSVGLLVYCEVLAEYDLADGFKNAGPLVEGMRSPRPDIEMHIQLARQMPRAVERIRKYMAHACLRMHKELVELEHVIGRASAGSDRVLDRLFMNPAIGLFQSGAPLLIARIAARELLRYWSSYLLEESSSSSADAAIKLWDDSIIVAMNDQTGEEIRASPLFNDKYLPDAIDILRETDREAGAISAALRRSAKATR